MNVKIEYPLIKKKSCVTKPKKARKSITLETKLNVLRWFEEGAKPSAISRALGLAISTICTIIENNDKIKASAQSVTASRATTLSHARSLLMENMEVILNAWIEEQNKSNIPLTTATIQEKAKCLFEQLKREQGENAGTETFSASKGWFERFKKRSNLNKMNIIANDQPQPTSFPSPPSFATPPSFPSPEIELNNIPTYKSDDEIEMEIIPPTFKPEDVGLNICMSEDKEVQTDLPQLPNCVSTDTETSRSHPDFQEDLLLSTKRIGDELHDIKNYLKIIAETLIRKSDL